ncbi:MAG: hypothetical protein V4662_03070 [Verrucomicrobiota bacterium]
MSRPLISIPQQMDLKHTAHGVVITRYWRHRAGLLLIPFCPLWVMMFYAFKSLSAGIDDPMITVLIPLTHAALGVATVYLLLAMLINRTRITVTSSEVSVTHGPLPWRGEGKVPVGQIDQLFSKEIHRTTHHGLSKRYQVWVALTDGTQSRLVDVGLEADKALYIEQQIELALHIRDQLIPGELPR